MTPSKSDIGGLHSESSTLEVSSSAAGFECTQDKVLQSWH